jgi:hypothetical protein
MVLNMPKPTNPFVFCSSDGAGKITLVEVTGDDWVSFRRSQENVADPIRVMNAVGHATQSRRVTHVPLFELLADDEAKILAAQVEIKRSAPHEHIFKAGDSANHGYVVMSSKAQVTTTDEDQREVVVEEPVQAASSALRRCCSKRSTSRRRLRWK